jgi:hypothetical protein
MSSTRAVGSKGSIRRICARLHYFLVIIAALLLMAASAAYATPWDATDDFSVTNVNPNGVWTYGQETSLNGTFDPFIHFGYNSTYANSPYWDTVSDSGSSASIWKNAATRPQDVFFGVKPGELSLNPGPDSQYAVIRWTSPITGTISINGKFGAGEAGHAQNYYIYMGNSEIYKEGTIGDGPFNLTEAVTIGTTIDFIVGPFNYFGNTPLAATIEVVPLPGAAWLFGSGLLGLGALRRFRKG